MPGADVAVDLGTARIRICVNGSDIVVDEPTVVAVDRDVDRVIAIGQEAYEMLGRTSDRVDVVYPLAGGVISDFDLVEQLIHHFMKRVSSSVVFMPRAIACVPGEITEVEKRAVVNAMTSAGARRVYLIEEPVAAAIGAGLDISSPHGSLVVDIGAGTTDMAVLSLNGVAAMRSIKIAGNQFDDAIMKYVKKKYALLIGKRTAEDAKAAIGCVYPRDEQLTFRVKGRHAISGLPRAVDLTSDEILEALIDLGMQIVRFIQNMLEETEPELVGDIYNDGIMLTGGCAHLYGFDTLIAKQTRMPVHVAANPENCVVLGCGKSIAYIEKMRSARGEGIISPLSAEY